jgi:archaellum biogenesis protein FlaJ (TadC family)
MEQSHLHGRMQARREAIASRIRFIVIGLVVSLCISIVVFIFTKNFFESLIVFVVFTILTQIYFFVSQILRRAGDIHKMEEVFPDFIALMSSNLRAGMTIDKAMLLSSRKEFAPLDREIIRMGKDIVTGKETSKALYDMSKRINSEKISRTIQLIVSGIRAGGNLAVLLEETASNMRERNFVEKRAASNVMMYEIFIFFAVAFGAPALFSLSTVLVQILSSILSNIPQGVTNTTISMPFTLTSINVSPKFIFYFSLVFLTVIDILASLVLGLVTKGKERDGLKFVIPLCLCSICVFFGTYYFLIQYFSQMFGSL